MKLRNIKHTLLSLFISTQLAYSAPGFLGVNLEQGEGNVLLSHVIDGSPAGTSGLLKGDTITHVAGVATQTLDALRKELAKTEAGDKVEFTINRNNEVKKLIVTLGEKPKAPERIGLINQAAPDIAHVKQWHNLPEGKKGISLADYKGKTVYLYCFQSWCPGCHSSGFPTMKKLIDHYKDDESVVFLTVQTVFEGFGTNTFERGKAVMKKFGLTIPMGQDGTKDQRSGIMRDFRTGGTPWTIIIDPEGKVRFSTFHTTPKAAIKLIDSFKKAEKK